MLRLKGGPRITKSSEWAKALGTRAVIHYVIGNLLVTWLHDDRGVPVQYYDGTVPYNIINCIYSGDGERN